MNLSEINFNDINIQEAGDWPPAGKAVLMVLVVAMVLGAGYYCLISDQLDQLNTVEREEQTLRQEFIEKQRVAANLEAFRSQLKQMETDLEVLLLQLPTVTEMPDMLENVSNTGKKNGLEFDLFKPEAEQPRDFYAAKPITIKAKGSYHQFGAFVSGVAALPRIVTLEKATLTSATAAKGAKSGSSGGGGKGATVNEPLIIEATLQTYRYMDENNTAAGTAGKGANKGAVKK